MQHMHMHSVKADPTGTQHTRSFLMYAKPSDKLWLEADQLIYDGQLEGKREHIHYYHS